VHLHFKWEYTQECILQAFSYSLPASYAPRRRNPESLLLLILWTVAQQEKGDLEQPSPLWTWPGTKPSGAGGTCSPALSLISLWSSSYNLKAKSWHSLMGYSPYRCRFVEHVKCSYPQWAVTGPCLIRQLKTVISCTRFWINVAHRTVREGSKWVQHLR